MAASDGVPGLEAAMKVASLEAHFAKAVQWCETMGARDLEEICEEEVYPLLVAELALRPLEERRLLKAFKKSIEGEAAGVSPGAATSNSLAGTTSNSTDHSEAALAEPSADVAVGSASPKASLPAGPTVFVKNTFIACDSPRKVDISQRAHTMPLQGSASIAFEADIEPDDDVEEVDDQAEDVASPDETSSLKRTLTADTPGHSPPLPGLCKTVTYDGFDSPTEWEWLNTSGSDVPQTGVGVSQSGPTDSDQSMVGMVMLPPPMPPMGPYGMPPMPMMPGMFPGCVTVPVDRFTTFPDMSGFYPMGAVNPEAAAAASAAAAAAAAAAASAVDATDLPMPPEPLRKPALERAFSMTSNIFRVRWTVDARKLKSTDKEAVSPSFDLSFAGPVQFRMVMKAKAMSNEKGGASFKRARGKGSVELRCTSEVSEAVKPTVTFCLSVGSQSGKKERPRGPVRHDFSERAICGLPEGQEEWDFSKVVDHKTQTFVVCLEVHANDSSGCSG